MNLSRRKRQMLYSAIHDEIVNVRIKLNLPAADDWVLAQAIAKIWKKQKNVLGMYNELV